MVRGGGPSTPFGACSGKGVDGRARPGHDAGYRDTRSIGIAVSGAPASGTLPPVTGYIGIVVSRAPASGTLRRVAEAAGAPAVTGLIPYPHACSAAIASGAHSSKIPRLVFCPTASRVAVAASRMRRPSGAPGRQSSGADTSALRTKSSTVMRWPGAWTCTFPGLGAASSSRQASTNAAAIFTATPPATPWPADRPWTAGRRSAAPSSPASS